LWLSGVTYDFDVTLFHNPLLLNNIPNLIGNDQQWIRKCKNHKKCSNICITKLTSCVFFGGRNDTNACLNLKTKNILEWFAQYYIWYWICVNCIIFIVKMSFPQHNHGGEPLFWHDDVTSCGDVSSRAVYSCDWKVRNKC